MNHVRSSGGTVQIRTSGSQSDPNSVGKKQSYTQITDIVNNSVGSKFDLSLKV